MAKIKLNALLDGQQVGEFYTTSELELRVEKNDKAVYVDADSGNRIVIEGNNFSYDRDEMDGGKIQSITFLNDNGKEFALALDIDMNAEPLSQLLLDDGVNAMMRHVMKQEDSVYGSAKADLLFGGADDDVLRGRGGKDELDGGKGDDRLIGSGGSDLFILVAGGDDVIADFDASGGGNDQDYIGVESMNDFKIRDDGDDVLLRFDNGDDVRLLDVKFSAISDADFQLV